MSTKKKAPTPKKKCQECGKERAASFYFKVDSPLFPDGMINICRDCIRSSIDIDNLEDVIGFFRQIDKPFYKDEWDKALNNRDKRHPIGAYLGKLGLQQYKGKTFADSDGIENVENVDIKSINNMNNEIETEEGKVIYYNDALISKWGVGYKKYEYLKLEKFYQDMTISYEVITANHKQMLMQLAKLSVEMDELLNVKDYTNYRKVSQTYDDLLRAAGFRPADRKNGSEATGIFSFSQVWAEVEKEGFVEPGMTEYEKDDIDIMLLYYIQFTQRLVGKSVSMNPPENWREEVEEDEQ